MKSDSFKNHFPFILLIFAAFPLFCSQLLHSGLWFDEAIEYYYSRFASGEVPGGLGTKGMYERIIGTYQPPLYNVLMHFWLKISDTPFFFRLFSLIMTFLGAIGIYFSVSDPKIFNLQSCTNCNCTSHNNFTRNNSNSYSGCNGNNWKIRAVATSGALAFLMCGSVSYYSMECGEYSLMLCLICWMLFFFVKAYREGTKKQLVCFFIFAVLSVYSQYGAAFPAVSLYIVLFIHWWKMEWAEKTSNTSNTGKISKAVGISNTANTSSAGKKFSFILLTTAITFFAAVIPLFYFFLLPQLTTQGTISVSHEPHPVYPNIILDFIHSLIITAYWSFATNGTPGWFGSLPLGTLSLPLFLLGAISILISIILISFYSFSGVNRTIETAKAAKTAETAETFKFAKLFGFFVGLILSCILCFVLYYIAVLLSFYAYNDWSPTVGSENFGGRYGLFLVPMWVMSMTWGARLMIQFTSDPKISISSESPKLSKSFKIFRIIFTRTFNILILIALIIHIIIGTRIILINWLKDDVREAYNIWRDDIRSDAPAPTILHQWTDAGFHYYLNHDPDPKIQKTSFTSSYLSSKNIVAMGTWSRNANKIEMDKKLSELGIYDLSSLYYVGPLFQIYGDTSKTFLSLMKEHSYKIIPLREGMTALYYLEIILP